MGRSRGSVHGPGHRPSGSSDYRNRHALRINKNAKSHTGKLCGGRHRDGGYSSSVYFRRQRCLIGAIAKVSACVAEIVQELLDLIGVIGVNAGNAADGAQRAARIWRPNEKGLAIVAWSLGVAVEF